MPKRRRFRLGAPVRAPSADDGMDVGIDTGLPVTEDEPKGSFTGTIKWVQLDLGIEDNEHLLTPGDRYRAAMMRQ